jgi:hypothetical protein
VRSSNPAQPIPVFWWILSALCATIACAYLVASGRKGYEILALCVAAAPVLAYLILARPYLMPYGIYVFLIPFDNLLGVGTFGTATRALGALSGMALILYALRQKRFNPLPLTVLTWSIYVVWAAVTIIWAIDQNGAITAAATLAQLVLLYTAIATAPLSKSDLRVIIGASVTGAIAAGFYGIWLFHHQHNLEIAQVQQQLQRLSIQVGDDRSIDANHYADSLLFPLVALVVWTLGTRKIWLKLVQCCGIAVILAGIYYSASRESILAFGVAMVFLIVTARRYRPQLAIVMGGALAASLTVPMVWVRFGNAIATGGSGRTSIWHTALAAVGAYWPLGAGIDNFANAYDSKYLTVFQHYGAGWHRASHDIFLQAIVELGIIGLALLLLALYVQFNLVGDIRPDDELFDYRLMVQGGMVALLVAAVFIDMMGYKYLWFLFATMTQVYAVSCTHRRTRRLLEAQASIVQDARRLSPIGT